MTRSKIIIVALLTFIIGFVGGFVLRPVISPVKPVVPVAAGSPALPKFAEARGSQYFVAHIDEARQIVAGCRDGLVRGGECAAAEEAIIKVDAAERRKRFFGN